MSERTQLIAPRWGDPFVNKEGSPEDRAQAWIDEVSRILSGEVADDSINGVVAGLTSATAKLIVDVQAARMESESALSNSNLNGNALANARITEIESRLGDIEQLIGGFMNVG